MVACAGSGRGGRIPEPVRWALRDGVLLALVVAAGLAVFASAARRVDYHPDESHTISNARYFEYLFVQRDVARPEWGDNYWTHTHPMVARYLLGAWLRARGFDLEALPPPHDWTKGQRENRALGARPSNRLLAEARMPMVALAAGVAGLLYLLGRTLAGPVAGVGAAGTALASPLAQERLVRALNEAPLMFLVLLGLLVAVLGVRRGRDGGLPVRWALAVGAVLGLAVGTKLTAGISLLALGAWASTCALVATRRARGATARARCGPAASVLGSWIVAVAVALGVFVASDPHLYPDPLAHIGHLVSSRVEESAGVQAADPRAVYDPIERPGYVLSGSLVEGAAGWLRRPPTGAALAGLGTLALAMRGRRAGRPAAEGLVLLTVLAYFCAISAGLVLNWPRWLVPTLVLGFLLSGIGAASVVGLVARASRLLRTGAGAGRVERGRDLSDPLGTHP